MFIDFKGNVAGQVGIQPRSYYIKCTHSLSQILAENWAQGLLNSVDPIKPTDVLRVLYGTNSASYGEFRPTITGNQIIVFAVVPVGIIAGAVVSGNIPKFSGTTGLMVDSGASLSNAAKTKICMADGAMTTNNMLKAGDTLGTVKDAGFSISAGQASWGGGSTSHAFTIAGLTTSSIIIPSISSQGAAASIVSYAVTANTLTVAFSEDPGIVVLNYHIISVAVALALIEEEPEALLDGEDIEGVELDEVEPEEEAA